MNTHRKSDSRDIKRLAEDNKTFRRTGNPSEMDYEKICQETVNDLESAIELEQEINEFKDNLKIALGNVAITCPRIAEEISKEIDRYFDKRINNAKSKESFDAMAHIWSNLDKVDDELKTKEAIRYAIALKNNEDWAFKASKLKEYHLHLNKIKSNMESEKYKIEYKDNNTIANASEFGWVPAVINDKTLEGKSYISWLEEMAAISKRLVNQSDYDDISDPLRTFEKDKK